MLKSKHLIVAAPVFITLSIAGYGLFAPHTKPTSSASVSTHIETQSATVDELIRLVNVERTKAGVAPLRIDERLNKSAQVKADDMKVNDYFEHVNPKTGVRGYTLIPIAEIGCIFYSENLSKEMNYNFSDVKTTVDGWMGSTPHMKAMLDARYDLTGFGISGPYVVEHFCDL